MEQAVQGIVRDQVFNLDDVGVSEWEDRKPKRVVITTSLSGQIIHHGVNRNLKYVTVVICMAVSEKHLIPYLITFQDLPALQDDSKHHAIEFGRHLIIKGNQKADVNSKTFAEYVKSVFISCVTKVRRERRIEPEESVSLIDNHPSHITKQVIDMLTTARVRIKTFVPNTTHIFQILDLMLFGSFKKVGKCQLPFAAINSTSPFIYRIYMDFKKALTDANIWAAFRGTWVGYRGCIISNHFPP
jgi:hypothetical protein